MYAKKIEDHFRVSIFVVDDHNNTFVAVVVVVAVVDFNDAYRRYYPYKSSPW